MAAKIVIDAGHGGTDPGAVYYGRQEKDDNLRLALAVGRILEDNGYQVVFTRQTDVYNSPYEKATIGNNADADFFVSFHRNSVEADNSASGVMTLVYDDSGVKARLARAINANLAEVGFDNLGVSIRPNLVVLRDTQIPSVLIEAGFINSDEDNQIFDDRFYDMAQGIADAIMDTVEEEQAIRYYVQTGLFRSVENAQELADRLWYFGYPADVDYYNGYYRVLVGPYISLEQVATTERQLRNNGFQTLVIQQNG